MAAIDETFPNKYKACGTAARPVAPYQCRLPSRTRTAQLPRLRGVEGDPDRTWPTQVRGWGLLVRPLLQGAASRRAYPCAKVWLRDKLSQWRVILRDHAKWDLFRFLIASVSHVSILGPRFP